MIQAHFAKSIFTGDDWLTNAAVLVEDNLVVAVVSAEEIPGGATIIDCGENMLVPCFIDLQIYGAHGFLLAVKPSAETLQNMYEYCKAGGAPYFQPTVATNTYDVIYKCIDAIKEYWNEGGEGVIGLHVEGPWISKAKRGAHIEAFIHSPSIQQAQALLEYGKGIISMITLAPEECSDEVIDLVQSYGVIVSAGHSNATYGQGFESFDKGIPAATHLYNAMSPLQHRAPGMVGAVLQHPGVMCSIVADGLHVDFAAISIAKKVMGQRLFFITDAVTETTEGYYPHHFEGDKYVSNGILSGSALNMAKCVKNGVEKAGIDLSEALRMASMHPAKVMKLDHRLGRIAKGFTAAFTVLNPQLEVVDAPKFKHLTH